DAKDTWLTSDSDEEFSGFISLGSKEAKADASENPPTVFRTYSLGVSTNRDSVVYDFDRERLATRIEKFCDDYNAELHRWQKKGCPENLDEFLSTDTVKWSRNLKRWFGRAQQLEYSGAQFRSALYRPFTAQSIYFARIAID